jgi:23S rRNA (uridine2552-2'-O)-methyltransferase
VEKVLGGKVDVVLSDMAAPSTGHKQTDHLRIIALCEAALEFSKDILNQGGTFCAKVLQGGTESQLLNEMRKHFKTVRHAKPKSSRSDSSEMYVVALGFRGKNNGQD